MTITIARHFLHPSEHSSRHPFMRRRHLVFGALAGTIGTLGMDALLYTRYRRGGGTDSVWNWESARGVSNWDGASAPGQVGRKAAALVMRRQPPDRWARSMTNGVHLVTGLGWGVQYAALTGRSSEHPVLRTVMLGPVVWLSGYVVLPFAGVYKPIWKYDPRTLSKDLSAHLVYGVVTAAAFESLRSTRRRP